MKKEMKLGVFPRIILNQILVFLFIYLFIFIVLKLVCYTNPPRGSCAKDNIVEFLSYFSRTVPNSADFLVEWISSYALQFFGNCAFK